jgi:hypothetical protein
MKQDKDTTGINFQMDNGLYTKMKIKLALDNAKIKDYITHLVERDLNADERITK